MAATPHPIKLALEIMDAWLGLPEYTYKATVYRFSHKLPPERCWKRWKSPRPKIPDGGRECLQVFLRRLQRQDPGAADPAFVELNRLQKCDFRPRPRDNRANRDNRPDCRVLPLISAPVARHDNPVTIGDDRDDRPPRLSRMSRLSPADSGKLTFERDRIIIILLLSL